MEREERDYLRWKAMRVNQEDSKREVEVYTKQESLLKDLDSSAQGGFVSAISLDCFVNEIDSIISKKGFVNLNMKKRLEEKASRNTDKNLYAMAESASRVSDAGEDFAFYEREALRVAKKYGLNETRLKDKFKELSMNYLENLYEMAEIAVADEAKKDFLGSMSAFYDCQKSALAITKKYIGKREVLAKFDAIKEKYGVKI